MAEGTGYKYLDSVTSGSSRSESKQNALVVIMSDPELQRLLSDDTKQTTQVPQRKNERPMQMRKSMKCLRCSKPIWKKIDEKSRQLELKGKADKEVVQLNFKGNQMQYELNAKVDAMLNAIETANLADNDNPRITTLVKDVKGLLKRRQK